MTTTGSARVTGKRSKTRIVPIVPAVREAIDSYVRQCPYPLSGDAPLFVGARGGPLNPDLVRRSVAAARRRLIRDQCREIADADFRRRVGDHLDLRPVDDDVLVFGLRHALISRRVGLQCFQAVRS